MALKQVDWSRMAVLPLFDFISDGHNDHMRREACVGLAGPVELPVYQPVELEEEPGVGWEKLAFLY